MDTLEQFVIRTRGNTPWFRKPKVYISYYSRDLELVEKITEILLVKKDCAVFFCDYTKGDPEPKALRTILEETQVFVIPITEEYLTRMNSAKTYELPAAKALNIPQLPFLCTNVHRNVYKEVFGTTHSFRIDPDDAASFFDNKLLSIFLDEFLLEDEQIKKSRSAFPYHLFLSYRRHDRSSVLPIMERIHQDEICQYVSVWYDEYLPVGKKFDTAIEEKIANCDVFAVLVTPELLEKNSTGEENYVVACEYPAAQVSGVKLLPIEVDAVELSALNAKLPGVLRDVSRLVKAEDGALLRQELCGMLPNGGQRVYTMTKEQLYDIGIAYYNGLEVERSYLHARRFFEKAAEAGHFKACDRLAYMYYHGDGVQRDSKKAASIQRSVFPKIIKRAMETLAADDADSILYAVTRCCTFLTEANDVDGTHEVCKEAITALQKLTSKKPGTFNELLGDAYASSGHYALLRGDWDQAIEDYDHAIRVLVRHYRRTGNPNYSKLSGYRQSASIAIKKTKDKQKAKEYLIQAQKEIENITDERTEEELASYANNCISLINIERHYLDVALERNKREEANQAASNAKYWYDKALAIYDRLDALPVKHYESEKALLIMNYGLLLKMNRQWRDAESLLLASLEVYESLQAQRPQVISLELARNYVNLGNLFSEPHCFFRDSKRAKSYYSKAGTLFAVYPNRDTIPFLEELATYYYAFVLFYTNRGLLLHADYYIWKRYRIMRLIRQKKRKRELDQ